LREVPAGRGSRRKGAGHNFREGEKVEGGGSGRVRKKGGQGRSGRASKLLGIEEKCQNERWKQQAGKQRKKKTTHNERGLFF